MLSVNFNWNVLFSLQFPEKDSLIYIKQNKGNSYIKQVQ